MAGCHATVYRLYCRRQRSCGWNNGFARVLLLNKWFCERGLFWPRPANNRINRLPTNSQCNAGPLLCGVVEFANKGLAVFGRLRRDEDAKLSTVPIRLLALSRRRRSAEHTSELQSLRHLVCRRLLDDRHIAIRLAVCPQPRHRSPYFGSR